MTDAVRIWVPCSLCRAAFPACSARHAKAENTTAYFLHTMKQTPFERAPLRRVFVWETPMQVAAYLED